MMVFNKTKIQQTDRKLVLSRVLPAPRELVWDVFTTPEHVEQWWGPRGWKATIHEMDVRVGGVWRYSFRGANQDRWVKATYQKVTKPEELVYLNEFTDASGEPLPGEASAGLVTANFRDRGDQTELHAVIAFPTVEALAGAVQMGTVRGTSETWDRLEQYLEQYFSNKSKGDVR